MFGPSQKEKELERTNAKQQEKIRSLSNQIDSLKGSITQFEIQLESDISNIHNLQEEKDKLEKQILALNEEMSKSTNSKQESITTIKELAGGKAKFETLLKKEQKTTATLEIEKATFLKSLDELNQEVISLKTTLDSKEKELQSLKSTLENTNAILEKTVSRNSELQQSELSATKQLEEQNERLKIIQSENINLLESKASSDIELSSATKKIKDQEISLDWVNNLNEALVNQIVVQKAEALDLEVQNRNLTETSFQLQATMQELQELREQFASYTENHQLTLKKKDAEIQSLKEINFTLDQELKLRQDEDRVIAELEELCQDDEVNKSGDQNSNNGVEENDDQTSQGSSNPSNSPRRASVETTNLPYLNM